MLIPQVLLLNRLWLPVDQECFYKTTTVLIKTEDGSKTTFAKVLLDSASHHIIMTGMLAKQLQLNSQRKETLSTSKFAVRGPQKVSTCVAHFNLITKDGSCLPLANGICISIRLLEQFKENLRYEFSDFLLSISIDRMADSIIQNSELSITIDMLAGSDYFWTIHCGHRENGIAICLIQT